MVHQRLVALAAATLLLGGTAAHAQDDQLTIAFTHHSSASNQFWQTVKNGMNDACEKVDAECQMIFTQQEGSVEQQLSNMQAAIARQPDALLTSIVDDNAFDGVIKRARDQGIIVLGVNVDDSEGADGNARQAFIGQSFVPAGYALGKAMSRQFPEDGPINALVGVSAPGQNWSEQRAAGITNFLDDYKKDHPDREVNYQRINSGTDLARTADRVGAALLSNPDTNLYLGTGFWVAAVAGVLQDRDVAPGKVLLGGFDLVPQVLDAMEDGYIQVQVDQQPYMQGFVPVMEAYLMNNFGLSAFDAQTGKGIVTPDDVESVRDMADKGLR